MLTLGTGVQSGGPSTDERQSAKGSASAASQVTLSTGCWLRGSVSGTTPVRRTAQRWRGSASAGAPGSGPLTSLKRRTSPRASPKARAPLPPRSSCGGLVAPAGRQQLGLAQGLKVIVLF